MVFTVSGQFRNLPNGLEIPDERLVVLTGPNNSGKTALLQWLNIHSPRNAEFDYVSPRRFELSNEVTIALNSDQELRNMFQQRKQYNETLAELAAPDPIRELVGLDNRDRKHVIEWHNRFFGELRVESGRRQNRFAAPRITIDGRLATQQGSGSRAVLSVLVTLLSPRSAGILIDEPEIGIEPQVQRQLAQLIRSVSRGERGLKRKRIYLATHSHLFLDREEPSNNYVVSKDADGWARLRRLKTEEELPAVAYALLGNSPTDLFFPDNILVVEGPSDQAFWRRALQLSGSRGVAVHYSDGEGAIRAALPAIDQMLKTQSYVSVYRQRLCVVVDGDVPLRRVREWREFLGPPVGRVHRLRREGVELYYPLRIIEEISGLPASAVRQESLVFLGQIRAGARTGTLGTFSGSKRELADRVASLLEESDVLALPAEARRVLLSVAANSFSTST